MGLYSGPRFARKAFKTAEGAGGPKEAIACEDLIQIELLFFGGYSPNSTITKSLIGQNNTNGI